jgi:VWFA-related protein
MQFIAVVAVYAVPFLWAQTPADPNTAVIRVETREVPIDITVTGKKGAALSDLTAKDFSVWEDGKPQTITSVVSASADPETSQKHFVLYFDFNTLRVTDQVASERFATEFIDGLASPDRFMAVASLGASGPRVLQDFTPARAALKQAVGISLNVNAASARQQSTFSNPVTLTDSLKKIAQSLAPAPGRKALLLFTGGYSEGYASALKELITTCNRANVAVYVVAGNSDASAASGDLQNIHDSPLPPRPGSVHLGGNTDSDPAATFAQLLANGTGGEALGFTASLKDQLAAVAREQDEYYRVFYTPPPAKEGTCHILRVATNTRGLTTRARNEYCTEKPVDLVAGKIAGEGLESRAAGAGAVDATTQLPYFYTGTNRAVVHLSVVLVPTGMKFEKNQSGLHGQIDVVGTVLRLDGATAARFADTKSIDLANQQSADAFTKTPYHYEQQFTVPAGTYNFQIAMDAGPNSVGKVEVPLKVDPWNSTALGIGGIAFSTEIHPADQAGASAAPILEGQGPLIAGGKQFVPAATNRFQKSQTIYFYTEVYDPALGSANPPPIDSSTLKMQYRVLDQKTGEVKMDTGLNGVPGYIHAGNPVVPFATRLSVAQLPAGSYRLEVRAAIPLSQDAVARIVDFELK